MAFCVSLVTKADHRLSCCRFGRLKWHTTGLEAAASFFFFQHHKDFYGSGMQVFALLLL